MALLPYSLFRRVKRYVQFASVILFLGLFVSDLPILPGDQRPSYRRILLGRMVPAHLVSRPVPAGTRLPMANLGPLSAGLPGLGSSPAALAAISYALAYRWFFLRSAEATEGPVRSFRTPDWVFTGLDSVLMRSGFYRGSFRFLVKTVARSDRHSAAFATLMGIGITFAVLSVLTPSRFERPVPLGLLTANLTLLYSVLTGSGSASEFRPTCEPTGSSASPPIPKPTRRPW